MRAISAFRLPIGRWAAAPAAAALLAVVLLISSVSAAPTVKTDEPEYFGTETVKITGSGYGSSQSLDIVVLTPSGVFTGDGTGTTIPPRPLRHRHHQQSGQVQRARLSDERLPLFSGVPI